LTRLVSEGLGAAASGLDAAFGAEHTSFLRLNFYPVEDPLAGEAADAADLGIHHHTDAGGLTVLLQDNVLGLQVYRDGLWHSVQPLAGAFVINIGDMVQVWSNDRYRAPVHRVLAMDRAERRSLPFFYNPAYSTMVAPLAAVVDAARPARYAPFSWGEFRRRRADGDFADYGTEVQISDYRL
jgi:isopenicillin N synthase-like dioxygenase